MKLNIFALTLAAAACFSLPGCSPQDAAAPAATVQPAQAYGTVASTGKGFTVGAMMSANTVYVLFDPQCPHCGHLWEASVPLQPKVKFVWIPVAFINAKSAPQGAALLGSANPAEAMAAHEKLILSGQGGMSASADIAADVEQAIKKNTALFNSMGADSVPFIVAKNLRTGAVVTNTGAMETPALATFLGMD
jgi:thiol:disulfide interchange protein DsbG